ncbi:MAG: diguanylate cyclase [Methylococcales bacterium]|nr:MAG: diguanylate cyclase [Methylococcales bacterium]
MIPLITKPKILIVDNSPDYIETLADILQDQYELYVAKSGEQALLIAESGVPLDLILLDIVMPNGISGMEVCQQLKSNHATAHIPILFVTALTDEQDELLGFNLGAADYITKPVRPAIVRARVKTHILLKKQTEQPTYLAFIDQLTLIPNRRNLDELLSNEWTRAKRNKTAISALLIDIDHFAAFNEHYGKRRADECLQQIAQSLNSNLKRSSDFIARFGGEEFIVILPDSDASQAKLIAERLLTNVTELNIQHEHSITAPLLTVSIGGVTSVPSNNDNTISALLNNLDTQLLRAKAGGRNQVCFAD